GISAVIFVGMLGVSMLIWSFAEKADPVPQGLARVTLEDGSILVLRELTTGPTHDFKLPMPDASLWDALGFGRSTTELMSGGPPTPAWIAWLSRHDATTGKSLEFDDWSHCIAETASGHQIEDENAGMILISNGQIWSSRPFKPLPPPPKLYGKRVIRNRVYRSQLKALRPDGDDFQLHVFENDIGKVATFRVPFPSGAGGAPTWTPQPMPQTATDGDIAVTLESLPTHRIQEKNQPEHLPRIVVEPKVVTERGGQPTDEWGVLQYEFEDALGNRGDSYNCQLSPHEAAWKLKLRLFRNDDASFDASDVLNLHDQPIPAIDTIARIDESFVNGGVNARVLAICGSGQTTVKFRSMLSNSSSFGTSSSDRWKPRIETDLMGSKSQSRIESQLPIVVVQTSGRTPDDRVSLSVSDQAGNPIETRQHAHHEPLFFQFDPPAGTESVNLRLIIQRARNVEFLVEPPKMQ
ncbi:MAG: hypothetical protein KDA52_18735, partial [Planctomycetaceae bacterium]|nr:hypothetical protein [Planctomycetaceae bacterium]